MADCTDPERQSTDCTVREMDDVMDILVQIDERKLLSALPSFVADNSDNLSSSHMDVGEMHTILNKIDKLEAILFGVQTAVYIVRMIIDQTDAATESNDRFFNKTNRFAQNESANQFESRKTKNTLFSVNLSNA